MEGMPPPLFISSAKSNEDAPFAVSEGEDTDDCRRSVLSRLASSFSFRRLLFSRLDNVDCDGDFNLDHSDTDVLVVVVVVLPITDGHDGKVRKRENKRFGERSWGGWEERGVPAGVPLLLLFAVVMLLLFFILSLLVR